jgi:hypothetical protein
MVSYEEIGSIAVSITDPAEGTNARVLLETGLRS